MFHYLVPNISCIKIAEDAFITEGSLIADLDYLELNV